MPCSRPAAPARPAAVHGVGEARQHRAAVRVDDGGGAPAQPLDLAVAADAIDAIAADGDGFGKGRRRIAGVDAAVVDQEVDRAGVIVALRADDQPGDERDPDDQGDGDGGETCGHGERLILPTEPSVHSRDAAVGSQRDQ